MAGCNLANCLGKLVVTGVRYIEKDLIVMKSILRCGFYLVFISLLSCTSNSELMEEEVIVTGIRASQADDSRGRPDSEVVAYDFGGVESASVAKNKKDKIEKTWRIASANANSAVLSVGDEEKISPNALEIKVRIDGFRARVVVDGLYINPHDETLEGDFKFRLPDGAKPYYFAFGEALKRDQNLLEDKHHISLESLEKGYLSTKELGSRYKGLWKEPKEAIMVSKQKAAFAYEDTVSQQIDPALLEWSGAGIFSASVYPLQPKSINRVVIGYDIDLQRLNNDLYLDLPLTHESIDKRVHVTFGYLSPDAVQIQRNISGELKTPYRPGVVNGVLQEALHSELLSGIRVKIDAEYSPTLVGMDEVGEYFATQWLAELPQVPARNRSKAVFLLDTSLSASSDSFHLWVELLLETLTQNEAELHEFALMSFNTEALWWKNSFVNNNEESRRELRTYLYSLILEGATDLSNALEFATNIAWLEEQSLYDLFLYSDGAATWGERNAWIITESVKKKFTGKVFSYRLGIEGEDKALLEHLVRELGGANFHVQDKSEISSLATAHTSLPWAIEKIELTGARDILLGGRPSVIYPGQVLTIAGRKISNLGDELNLYLANANRTIEVKIPVNQVLPSSLTARTYGQIAVNQLEGLGELKDKVAASYANHFKVPGRASSLLMLESPEDYKRYNIVPKQDAYVVKTTLITDAFRSIRGDIALQLGNPKNQFISLVEKLSELSNVNMELPHAVTLLMERLPTEAFNKPRNQFNNKVTFQNQVSSSYLSGLAEENIYSLIVEESERRLEKFGTADAIKVMSNLVERAPSDVTVLRDVAYAAEAWGQPIAAFELHKQALNSRPFEPQSYSYLANLAEKIGKYDLALLFFEMGLAGKWDNRFRDYETIHKMDYLSFIERRLENGKGFLSSDYAQLKLKALKSELPDSLDMLIAVSWNTDRTDVDLHVIEPSGEECFYQNKVTRSKGEISGDVTLGYGPEFYKNKHAPKGKYEVYVKYFSDSPNKLGLKTKVNIRIIENWGTPQRTERSLNVELEKAKQKQLVSKVRI